MNTRTLKIRETSHNYGKQD